MLLTSLSLIWALLAIYLPNSMNLYLNRTLSCAKSCKLGYS